MGLNIEQKHQKEAELNDARLREGEGAGMEGRDSGEKANSEANDAFKEASMPKEGNDFRKEMNNENANKAFEEDKKA
ncbi:MAG: hypothetical protein IK105_07145 [Thermoguttaceae bacterium]|nr:hypothetical protein [Thermoguttaceae bacterium]